MKKRKRKEQNRFSAVLAVKANARSRVGQPPPSRVLTSKAADRAAKKHKRSLPEEIDTGDESGREPGNPDPAG